MNVDWVLKQTGVSLVVRFGIRVAGKQSKYEDVEVSVIGCVDEDDHPALGVLAFNLGTDGYLRGWDHKWSSKRPDWRDIVQGEVSSWGPLWQAEERNVFYIARTEPGISTTGRSVGVTHSHYLAQQALMHVAGGISGHMTMTDDVNERVLLVSMARRLCAVAHMARNQFMSQPI